MNFLRWSVIFCLLYATILTKVGCFTALTDLPLIFDPVKENPFKTRILINPNSEVFYIKDLSRRDVVYIQNNDTLGIEEKLGDWVKLISNDATPSIRYLQLKNALCDEKDYRLSWTDAAGREHDAVVQRLPATPQEWNPNVKIRVNSVSYDEPVVSLAMEWSLEGEEGSQVTALGEDFDQLSNVEPAVELLSCETLFTSRIPSPTINIPKKMIFFHSDYVDHICVFALRLRITAYDKNRNCKAILQTSNEKSLNITLRCDKIPNFKCSNFDYVDACRASCDVQLDSRAENRQVPGGRGTKPVVKLQWHPLNLPRRAKVLETLIRMTSMEALYNNFPFSQSKHTVLVLNSSTYDLTPFSESFESFIGVQVCVFFQLCDRDPKWWLVPNHAVFASRLIDEIPVASKHSQKVSSKSSIKSTTVKPSTRKTRVQEVAGDEDEVTSGTEIFTTIEPTFRLLV